MPLDNSLNVSELLRRLGVKGDSLGSAPLLESLRLTLQIGDLSDLVPPVPVPIGGVSRIETSGVGTAVQYTLQCRSPGGLVVGPIEIADTEPFEFWITPVDPMAGAAALVTNNYAFGQLAQSVLFRHPPGAKVSPADVVVLRGPKINLGFDFPNYVGPGQFFNIEGFNTNVGAQHLSIMWKEFPGAISPEE